MAFQSNDGFVPGHGPMTVAYSARLPGSTESADERKTLRRFPGRILRRIPSILVSRNREDSMTEAHTGSNETGGLGFWFQRVPAQMTAWS